MIRIYADAGDVPDKIGHERGARLAWIKKRGSEVPMATAYARGVVFPEDDDPKFTAGGDLVGKPGSERPAKRSRKSTIIDVEPQAQPFKVGDSIKLEREGLAGGLDALDVVWPIPPNEVFRVAEFGATNTGKSQWAADNVVRAYNMLYPENRVYVFAFSEGDPAFRNIKNVEYIKMSQAFVERPPAPATYRNSLCVFDDIESLRGDVLDMITKLRDQILAAGRKLNISTVTIGHEIHARDLTRVVITECDLIVLFTQGTGNVQPVKRLLVEKFGLAKDRVDQMLEMSVRWFAVKKTYPKVMMSPREITAL